MGFYLQWCTSKTLNFWNIDQQLTWYYSVLVTSAPIIKWQMLNYSDACTTRTYYFTISKLTCQPTTDAHKSRKPHNTIWRLTRQLNSTTRLKGSLFTMIEQVNSEKNSGYNQGLQLYLHTMKYIEKNQKLLKYQIQTKYIFWIILSA